jgi:hypothetical protein
MRLGYRARRKFSSMQMQRFLSFRKIYLKSYSLGKESCLDGVKVSGVCSSDATDSLTLKLKEIGDVLPLACVRLRGVACNKGQEHFYFQRIHCPQTENTGQGSNCFFLYTSTKNIYYFDIRKIKEMQFF